MPKITFWFEFASTYSYLTAMRIEDVCRAAGVDLAWQPFLLGPIFKAQGWNTSPFNIYPAKGRHMWRDMARRAAQRGLPPVAKPVVFPQNGLLTARIATAGLGEPWLPDWVRAVYGLQFSLGQRIDEEAHLRALLSGVGAPADEVMARAQTDPAVKSALRQTTEEAQTLGIFGAPSFITQDAELFWGDDRLEDAISWALAGSGAARTEKGAP